MQLYFCITSRLGEVFNRSCVHEWNEKHFVIFQSIRRCHALLLGRYVVVIYMAAHPLDDA